MNINDDLGVVVQELRTRAVAMLSLFKEDLKSNSRSVRWASFAAIHALITGVVFIVLCTYLIQTHNSILLVKQELSFLREQHGGLVAVERQGEAQLGFIKKLDSKSTASNFISLVSYFAGKYNVSVSSLGEASASSFASDQKNNSALIPKRFTLYGQEHTLHSVPFEFEGGYSDFVKMHSELKSEEVLWSLDNIRIEVLTVGEIFKPVFIGQYLVFSKGAR